MQTKKQRTLKQNRALHLMYEHLAQELNDAGWDMKRTLKQEIDIAWTKESVKEYLWRPIQELMLKKKSTTELTTKDIDKVMNTLIRHLGEKLGIEIRFPSVETLMMKQRKNENL
jgi:hypothetical protein